jgi:c-di-GMP-binding flagellar brake protein YcgR
MNAFTERRKRRRIRLHWPVQLLRRTTDKTIRTTTLNLSSDGFYCFSPEALDLGEVIRCTIAIPSHDGELRLRCRVRIVRVEADPANGGYGMGCQILQFSIASGA